MILLTLKQLKGEVGTGTKFYRQSKELPSNSDKREGRQTTSTPLSIIMQNAAKESGVSSTVKVAPTQKPVRSGGAAAADPVSPPKLGEGGGRTEVKCCCPPPPRPNEQANDGPRRLRGIILWSGPSFAVGSSRTLVEVKPRVAIQCTKIYSKYA